MQKLLIIRARQEDGLPLAATRVTPATTTVMGGGTNATARTSCHTNNEVPMFKKGIRRDATLFKELKDQMGTIDEEENRRATKKLGKKSCCVWVWLVWCARFAS